MLVVALCLSAIAAFYSIIGLTAIFASAVIPVAIMGSILEIAKLTVTVWLHEYWHRCQRAMKIYLVPAVGVLMLITSMGIFGFLSKAHLDQAVPAGDVSAQVAIYDDKIKSQRDNIEAARKALRQMDDAVDQLMARSQDEQGAQRAANLRRNQGAERNRLNTDISRAQAEIVKLQEQRAPIASQARKVEAEVGPIKYIAALIYGDNPDANLLEKAVRWVIIILVVVFDPLAIFMLLAATESYKWEKHGREGDPEEPKGSPPSKQPVNDAVQRTKIWAEDLWNRVRRSKNASVDDDATVTPSVAGQPTSNDMGIQPVAAVVGQSQGIPPEQWGGLDLTPRTPPAPQVKYVGDADEEIVESDKKIALEDLDSDNEDDAVKRAKTLWKERHPDQTLKEQRALLAVGRIPELPWMSLVPECEKDMIRFGQQKPQDAIKGDIFVDTSALPTVLFKYNGSKWIEVDKRNTDRYAYNDQYIDYLIDKIGTGEYDPELLSDAERSQIEQRLKKGDA